MADVSDMVPGATNALKVVLGMGEMDEDERRVLVITDAAKEPIGRAFLQAAKDMGCAESDLYVLQDSLRPLSDIPEDLRALVDAKYPVIINAFSGMAEETPFRIKLIKAEIGTKARVGHAPGITEEMMTEGPMTADYSAIAKRAEGLMKAFQGAESVHVTAPGGTDITVYIDGREFETDVYIKPGTFGNLPAGEIWCGPIEDKGHGRIVCDGSIGDLGAVTSPLTLEVEGGRVVAIYGDDPELVNRVDDLIHVDEMAPVIGELGIGLNPMARITGNLLEDEKAGSTAHIAFGNNEEMPGGQNHSKTHRDFLFHKPTMTVRFRDGSERVLIKDGDLNL